MHHSGAAPADAPALPSGGYLALLADARKLAIMHALAHTSLPGAVMARRLGISERRVRAHMRVLLARGIVRRVRSVSPSHRVAWSLSEAGSELLELHELIVRCERRLRAADTGSAGSRPLLQTICYPHVRAIVWALSGGPLTPSELERELEWIPRGTLAHGLENMCESDVAQARGQHARTRYELRRRVRGPLGLIALSGVRWRLRFTPEQQLWSAGDLLGLLALLAPVVRVAVPGVQGVCLMQALPTLAPAADAMRWPDAHVSVLRGRIAPRPAGPSQAAHPPDARLSGSDLDWCETLLRGDFERIEIKGDQKLAHALLDALAGAVRA
jgi:DNA-binding HxlR family transcriptional regulator